MVLSLRPILVSRSEKCTICALGSDDFSWRDMTRGIVDCDLPSQRKDNTCLD